MIVAIKELFTPGPDISLISFSCHNAITARLAELRLPMSTVLDPIWTIVLHRTEEFFGVG